MKRENEFVVGVVMIAALALVVGGALWLSGAHLGKSEAVYTSRFRTVGSRSPATASSTTSRRARRRGSAERMRRYAS